MLIFFVFLIDFLHWNVEKSIIEYSAGIKNDEEKKIYIPTGADKKYDSDDATEEIEEIPFVHKEGVAGLGSDYAKTGFPKPKKRYKIMWESQDMGIEEPYYWMFNYFQQDLGFAKIIKTEDVFSASENSACTRDVMDWTLQMLLWW